MTISISGGRPCVAAHTSKLTTDTQVESSTREHAADTAPATDAKQGAGLVSGGGGGAKAAPEAAGAYAVKSGDTLGAIAQRSGVSLQALTDANRDTVSNPDLIMPGQTLRLPGSQGAGVAPAEAASAVTPAGTGGQKMIYPVGPTPISSEYGDNAAFRKGAVHTGIDFPRPAGTPIHAAAGGTVVFAGWEQYGGGNAVVIDHGDGVYTRYAHQSAIGVAVGQQVNQGDVVGKVGTTGNSTGNHLHFEVLENGYRDPAKFSVNPHPYLDGSKTIGAAPAPAPDPAPAPAPAPTPESPAPAPAPGGGGSYTVQRGDTLSSIAARHGIDWKALHAANRATVPNENLIFPGQQLQLPGGSAAP